MAIEPPPQATEPSRQGTKLPAPILCSLAVAIGWYLAGPVVFFAFLPFVTPGDTLEACLFGAGGLLWFFSCFGIYGLLLGMADAYSWKSAVGRTRMSLTIAVVGWFLGWFPLLFAYGHLTASLIEQRYFLWINLPLFILGTIFWLISCYWIYDMLFTMAEARWPVAKAIREAIGEFLRFLFRRLLASRHHPSP